MSETKERGRDLLPLRRMAARLSVPSKWLKDRALAGDVPALLAGNRWLFDAEAVTQKLADMAKHGTNSTQVTGRQAFKNGKLVDVVEGGDE